ncbi:hypothetical protein FDECE_15653 [Fusarium decemcellulare]|nr:hypothetical protein FDECE_15653 [Fusarium decemcellulare]
MRGTLVKILKSDGPLGVYSGISASLLRQLTYSTARFGIYEELKQREGPEPSFLSLIAMAVSSGFVGGIAGNFADVLNVRMQNDVALPIHQRRNYKHAIDGAVRMAREEGVASYFRGWLPNSSRAALTTASQLATYDVAKKLLMEHTPLGDTLTTQLSASFIAGLTAATVTSPIDVIKTRVMSSKDNAGVLETLKKISRSEGPAWVFKGWVPSFLRQGPHTIFIFFFLEMHRTAYRKMFDADGSQM